MVFVFYGLKYPTQLIFNDQEILDSLPKGLRKRMQAETYMDTIENIPLFTNLPDAVKVEVCSGFETYYCSPQEELCTEDEEPDSLFVVRNGDVLLSHKYADPSKLHIISTTTISTNHHHYRVDVCTSRLKRIN